MSAFEALEATLAAADREMARAIEEAATDRRHAQAKEGTATVNPATAHAPSDSPPSAFSPTPAPAPTPAPTAPSDHAASLEPPPPPSSSSAPRSPSDNPFLADPLSSLPTAGKLSNPLLLPGPPCAAPCGASRPPYSLVSMAYHSILSHCLNTSTVSNTFSLYLM